MATLIERFEKAQPLAVRYVEAKLRLEAIDREIEKLRFRDRLFERAQQVEAYESETNTNKPIVEALNSERAELKKWMERQDSWNEDCLYPLLTGEDPDEPDFEITVKIDGVTYTVLSGDSGLYVYIPNIPQKNSISSPAQTAKASLDHAKEAFAAAFPDVTPSPAELIMLAQVIETDYLRQVVAQCAPV